MGTTATILMLVLYVLMLVAGIYFKSYFDKKGANLATKEDFKELKAQTTELRQATKEIEAKIDDQMWNRQRQWEMKRDIMFTAVNRLNDVDSTLLSLNIFWQQKLDGQLDSMESLVTVQNGYLTDWQKAIRSFEEVESLTQVTCSIETMKAFTQLGTLLRTTASTIVNGSRDGYASSQKERDKQFGLAKLAIRKELGIPTSVMPLSSGSSATPTPGSQAPAADKPAHH